MLLFLSLATLQAQSKDKVWDIDGDGKRDYVELDTAQFKIVCKLSTQKYRPICSEELCFCGDNRYISTVENGFSYSENWMRAGSTYYFGYDVDEKRIRLVGMSRYEFGNAANDGSGESSVNLLTGKFKGNWNYYDHERDELFAIPTIESIMNFSPIFLEDFSDEFYMNYSDKCSELYDQYKNIEEEKRGVFTEDI